MQKLILTISLLLTASIIYAQTPQAIKYQAVARGESGDVIADADVSFRFSIVEGSPNGPSIYLETHSVTSNEFGLVNLNVGRGNAVTGSFSDVEWETGSYFLKVELDPDGGSSYNEMGTSELLTVPYAFHAGSADDVDDDDADPTNELITRLELIGAGLEIEEGGQVQTVNLSSLINDADADPSNELISEFEFRNDSIIITEAGVERAVEIDGFFSGEYEDLTGKPVFQDSINQYGFSGVYDSLSNLPNFQDSINTYGFDGDYNSLINQPDIVDSINTYGVITSTSFSNDSLFITESGTTFDVDLSSLQGAPQDLELIDDTLTITDHQSATPIDLTPYRSKWNENASGDLFSHKNIGLGVETPQFKLHFLDTLSSSQPVGAFFKTYIDDPPVPSRASTLEIESEGTTDNTHVGLRTRSLGINSSGINQAIRSDAFNGERNVGLHLRSGVNNTIGLNSRVNYGTYTEVANSSSQNFGSFNTITNATGAENVGVWGSAVQSGSAPSASGLIVSGYFQSGWDNSSPNYAVWAIASGGSSSENIGVLSQTDTSATATGVNLAGKFIGDVELTYGNLNINDGDVTIDGDLNVTGNISKGSGTFRIDHPLDPTNKELVHSFVESPDMMNVYNGNIETDGDGYATVELPEYFEEVNKDFRYQLTVVGTFAQAIIKEKVRNNKFVIQTNEPNVEVSWQVTGIRNDPYARKNRIQPVKEKDRDMRGKYIHPSVYSINKQKNEGKRNLLDPISPNSPE